MSERVEQYGTFIQFDDEPEEKVIVAAVELLLQAMRPVREKCLRVKEQTIYIYQESGGGSKWRSA